MPSSDHQLTEPAWIFANEDFKSIIASFPGAQSFAYHKGTRIILVPGKSRSTSANITRWMLNVIRRLEEVYLSSFGPSVHFWEQHIEDLLQTWQDCSSGSAYWGPSTNTRRRWYYSRICAATSSLTFSLVSAISNAGTCSSISVCTEIVSKRRDRPRG